MPEAEVESAPAVALTRDLVRIRSENPTGSEAEIAAFAHAWLAALPGTEVIEQEVTPGRANVVARLEGEDKLPPLILMAHMDTVPAGGGWSHEPFAADLVNGRIYGRGACDMKSGLATAMCAFAAVARSGRKPRRSLVFCATVDEEGPHMMGVNALVDSGTVDAAGFGNRNRTLEP
jgi:succinyl-diaminopimelate desuccinylase